MTGPSRTLLSSATTLDDGMIYFDARLSARYPTVEIRVADVCTEVGDSVLVAALARALVSTAAAQWRAGGPVPPCRVGLLRAAAWRAARSGLSEDLVDSRDASATPAWTMIDRLVDHISPALAATGDLDFVRTGLDRLHSQGTGAQRQRAVYRTARNLHDVVADAADRTVAAD